MGIEEVREILQFLEEAFEELENTFWKLKLDVQAKLRALVME